MSDGPTEIEFLSIEVVLALHQSQLNRFGGGKPARPRPAGNGNKRTGLLAAQVFLALNGVSIEHDSDAFNALTMGIAEGRIDKSAVAAELERIAKSKSNT